MSRLGKTSRLIQDGDCLTRVCVWDGLLAEVLKFETRQSMKSIFGRMD